MRILALFAALALVAPAAMAASKSSSKSSKSESKPEKRDEEDEPKSYSSSSNSSSNRRDDNINVVVNNGGGREPLPDEDILPAQGDIAIGFDTSPTLSYFANLVSDAGNGGTGLGAYPMGFEQMLSAKYFFSDTIAIRGRLGLTYDSTTTGSYYDNPVTLADPDNEDGEAPEIVDTSTETDIRILVGGGVEMRRGYRRLQGYFGGEALLGAMASSTSNKYGWQFSEDAQEWGVIGDGTERVLTESSGLSLVVGVRGFAGIEYFIVRKISIAAEYGIAASVMTDPRGTQTVERWEVDDDGDGSRVQETNQGSSAGSHLRFDEDNGIDQYFSGGTGAVTVNFHF